MYVFNYASFSYWNKAEPYSSISSHSVISYEISALREPKSSGIEWIPKGQNMHIERVEIILKDTEPV